MEPLYIALAIPAFFALIAVEVWVGRRRGQTLYGFADTITDLGCGVSQQATQILIAGALLFGYYGLHEHARLFTLPADAWWTWVVALLGVDLAYYWFHRASHRVNFIWATHVVHHQSEEYNLAVALRQSILQGFLSAPFYLPLALLGVPPVVFIAAATFDTLYQFWIHTRAVGKLGPLEWVLNTPSHHRVHHGINPEYIDKNYAGVLIVWDRMFGTFQEEGEEPAYGTVKPLRSWNPLWANVEQWAHIARMARRTERWRDKVKVWVMPPEWQPDDLGGPVTIPPASRETQQRYHSPTPRPLAAYITVSFTMVVGATTWLLVAGEGLGPITLGLLVGWVLLALAGFGALLEGRRWGVATEITRHAVTVPAVIALTLGEPWLAFAAGGAASVALAMGAWVMRVAREPVGGAVHPAPDAAASLAPSPSAAPRA
jgi:alkylglycerol monooxygenase